MAEFRGKAKGVPRCVVRPDHEGAGQEPKTEPVVRHLSEKESAKRQGARQHREHQRETGENGAGFPTGYLIRLTER
jgi:hypothetical protein